METYFGQVRTPQDAIILFEACRVGLLPRVQRRLSEKERQQIRSGSVFVWDEREAGMRRWTDGKSWSASRVSGSFLTYREMEGKRGGFNQPGPPASNGKKLPGINNKTMEAPSEGEDAEAAEDGEGPDGYRYKPDGLMKQSFSITTQDSRHLHLISYYSRAAGSSSLTQPTGDPSLRAIRPQKGMYPEANLSEANAIPAVTRGPLGSAPWPTAGQTPPAPQHHTYPQHPPPPTQYPYPPPGYSHGPMPHWGGSVAPGYPPGPYYTHPSPYTYYPHPHHAPHYPPPPHNGHPPPSAYPTPPTATLAPLVNGHSAPAPPPLRSPPITAGYRSPTSTSSLKPNPYGPTQGGHSTSSSAASAHSIQATTSGPPSNGSINATNGSSKPSALAPFASDPLAKPANAPTALPPSNLPRTTSAPSSTPPRTAALDRTIPSITSLLGSTGQGAPPSRTDGAGTPPGAPLPGIGMLRHMADPLSGSGRERDKSDLKRLDSHSLKFN